jgi:Kyakuja-Dileera-Zisupton transposase
MNMDYSICQALKYNTKGLTKSMVDYDVACGWIINFIERLIASGTLSLPEGMELIAAVGKFHLASHQGDCFVKFSLNFIEGAGQQDGEILETLWAIINQACGSIRAMSKSQRQEVLDDLMRDMNFKKLVNMGEMVIHSSWFQFDSLNSTTKLRA